MSRTIIGIVVGLMMLMTSVALADGLRREDSDDSSVLFDVEYARHGHAQNPDVVKHGFSSYEKWSSRSFRPAHATFYFEVDGDSERCLVVERKEGAFHARLYSTCARKTDRTLMGTAKVWRTDKRSLTVSMQHRLLGGGTYRWYMTVLGPCRSDDGGGGGGAPGECGDRVPDQGWITHR